MSTQSSRINARVSFYLGLAIIFTVVFIGWFTGSSNILTHISGQLTALGRLFGLIATVAVLLEVFLMSRIPFIEENFDLHENIDLHRLTGYTILGAISAHIVFLVVGYASGTRISWYHQFLQFNTVYQDVFKATLGTIVFFLATAVSVNIARKKMPYEIWFLSHLTLYGAILLTFLHQIRIGGDFIHQRWFLGFWWGIYFLVFGLLVWYRGLRQLIFYAKHGFRVAKVVKEAKDTYSVYITGKSIANYKYKPGQYATWRFISGNTWWESHPFSFSSPPNMNFIRFTFKEDGDFGKKIVSLKANTPVLIDGPRGAFTSDRSIKRRVVLIAGGIGIAPFMSSINGLLNQGREVVLFLATRNPNFDAFNSELATYQQRGLIVQHFYSEQNQYINASALSQIATDEIVVFICGPDSMSKTMEKMLIELGLPKNQIMTERFAY
jgi:predicted ferric reductase